MKFRIIGFLISIATFPGIIIHEVAHLYFCRQVGLEVFDYSLFRLGSPMGYVIHEPPVRLRDKLLITVAPVFINSVGAFLFALTFASLALFAAFFGGLVGANDAASMIALTWTNCIGTWLAVSLGAHAFPSIGDAQSFWRQVRDRRHGLLGWIIGLSIAAFILLGSIASFFWLDILFGYAIALLAKNLVAVATKWMEGLGFFALGMVAIFTTSLFVGWVSWVAFRAHRPEPLPNADGLTSLQT